MIAATRFRHLPAQNGEGTDLSEFTAEYFQRSEPAWFVVQCRPGQNERARLNLENQDFPCFDPHLQVERVRQGRRAVRSEPLFPGYVFVRLALSGDNWHTIRSTRGVRRMVHVAHQPARVPEEVIRELRERSRPSEEPDESVLRQGDQLRIKRGPFAELEGIFQRFDGDERVIVLLNMLNKQQELALSAGDVELS